MYKITFQHSFLERLRLIIFLKLFLVIIKLLPAKIGLDTWVNDLQRHLPISLDKKWNHIAISDNKLYLNGKLIKVL